MGPDSISTAIAPVSRNNASFDTAVVRILGDV
jgi:hypothetical protein